MCQISPTPRCEQTIEEQNSLAVAGRPSEDRHALRLGQSPIIAVRRFRAAVGMSLDVRTPGKQGGSPFCPLAREVQGSRTPHLYRLHQKRPDRLSTTNPKRVLHPVLASDQYLSFSQSYADLRTL